MMTVGQEIPHPSGTNPKEIGWFTATLTGQTLRWKLSLPKLTSTASGVYVQLGDRGERGPALLKLCGQCSTPVSGTTRLTATQRRELLGGHTYANARTALNPAGEIRGQIRRASS